MRGYIIYFSSFLIVPSIFTTDISAQGSSSFLSDRGKGIALSQFGSYVEQGQLIVYPFYEYYFDSNFEYEPYEFGFVSKQEFRGRYHASEGLIFIAYGITNRLVLEFEAGIINARMNKSENDNSELNAELKESGLSDVEGQLRWRWNFENENTPEFFNYFEFVLPTGEKNSLIGTNDWEFKLGTGIIKGFNWGTITARVSVDYIAEESSLEVGEFAFEYLKRISEEFRIFLMVEGSEDEISLIPEIQWHISKSVFAKLNTGVGITSKATDFAPETGIMIVIEP